MEDSAVSDEITDVVELSNDSEVTSELKVENIDSDVHSSPVHEGAELDEKIDDSKRLEEDTTGDEVEDSLENVSEDNREIVDRLETSLEDVIDSSVVDRERLDKLDRLDGIDRLDRDRLDGIELKETLSELKDDSSELVDDCGNELEDEAELSVEM